MGFVVVALLCTWSQWARCEAPRPMIALYGPPCAGDPYDREALVEALKVEAAALGVHTVVGKAPAAGVVVSNGLLAAVVLSPDACTPGASELSVELLDARFCGRAARSITLADLEGAGRHRTLAIAIVEFLQANWTAHTLTSSAPRASADRREARESTHSGHAPPSEACSRSEPRAEEPRHPPSFAQPAWSFEGWAQARTFVGRSTALFGPELALWRAVSPNVGLELGAEIGFGEPRKADSPPMLLATANVGASVWSSAVPALRAGPRLHVGFAGANASRLDAHESGVALLAGAAVSGAIGLAPGWNALLGVELGAALVGPESLGPEPNQHAVRGMYVASRIGVSTEL